MIARCLVVVALLLAAVLPAGLGDAASPPDALSIYSSLPFHGPRRAEAADVVRAERLALEEAGGIAAGRPIELVSVDDSSGRYAAGWDPERVVANARSAARDTRAIAYLGELNSGASAISIPIINEAGILQVSPTNSYTGLTRREGADRGEPDKYYPTGTRTYGRVAPADHVQAGAIMTLLASLGVKRVLLLDDMEIYGVGLTRMVRRRAIARGIEVRGPFHVDNVHWRPATIRRLARRAHAGAMMFGGITENRAPGVFAAVHRVAPEMTLVGADGVAEPAFAKRLSAGAARRTFVTDYPLARSAYPPEGQAFYEAYRARYGHESGPYGIFGYEAMKVVLAAIDAGRTDRAATIRAFFATRDRDSVLGRYSIDGNGDTTLSRYGVYRVKHKRLVFDRVVDANT